MELRNYQNAAVAAIPKFFTENPTGNPLIVCPTASGKSVIQAAFIKYAFQYPGQRWLLLSHVMELIDQNHERLMQVWPEAPAGIYCAKLKRKDNQFPITVASIQSIHRKAVLFGHIDGIVIDEAHLLSPSNDTMYRKFIDELKRYNPNIKVIGLTATPFRLSTGLLHVGKNRLFTDIAYEIPIALLLKEGHIVNLVSKQANTQADLTGIKTVGGDFSLPEMESRMDTEEMTNRALDEVFRLSGNRRSWLFFCSGVQHAFHIRDKLRERGITAEAVHGDTPDEERKQIIKDFKEGKIKAVCNMAVFTTGFDAPNIDNIIMLRGTKSPGLYIQMLGRGMRLYGRTLAESIANGKRDCQVLDFCSNIDRFGPINLMKVEAKEAGSGKIETIKPPLKTCPNCQAVQHAAMSQCAECGHKFELRQISHNIQASSGVIIAGADTEIKTLDVNRIEYTRHKKAGKPDSMKVTYYCGVNQVMEWICFEHGGNATGMARLWWRNMAIDKYLNEPETVTEALERVHELKLPSKLNCHYVDGKYKVLSVQEYVENTTKSA